MTEHIKFHSKKINDLIRYAHTNGIKSFAYGYSDENLSKEDYWSVISHYQKYCNADNNDKFIFFYSEDELKREKYLPFTIGSTGAQGTIGTGSETEISFMLI